MISQVPVHIGFTPEVQDTLCAYQELVECLQKECDDTTKALSLAQQIIATQDSVIEQQRTLLERFTGLT